MPTDLAGVMDVNLIAWALGSQVICLPSCGLYANVILSSNVCDRRDLDDLSR
jgi:hypothetical protein